MAITESGIGSFLILQATGTIFKAQKKLTAAILASESDFRAVWPASKDW